MIHIKKYNPWIFYPSVLCDTFPENPATRVLSGNYNFQIEIISDDDYSKLSLN